MKQSVLVLGNSDSGLYDFRKEVLMALMQEGYEVHVSVPDTGYLEKIKKLGCICHETVMERRGMNPLKDGKLLLFYRKLLKTIHPAAVLTYTIKPNIYGGVACRLAKVPYLVNITGLGTTLEHDGPLQKLIVLLYRTGMSGAGCVFFQNEQNLAFMRQKGCLKKRTKTRVISGSGVNLEEHPPMPYPKEDTVRFVSVMRIMKDKGIEELLEAARRIHEKHPETVFELLGAYEEETRARYEPMIEDLQSKGIVRYYGYRDDMPEFYRHCQAVIHPSYHEGMSNVLLEGAAMGRALITSDIPGCREVVDDGISGYLCPKQDTDALICAVRAFAEKSFEERKQMGYSGRKLVEEKFDKRIAVAQTLGGLGIAEALRNKT